MIIYLILIGYIMVLPLVIRIFTDNRDTVQKFVAIFGMAGIFLVLALKAPTVGSDIMGYSEQYYLAKNTSWNDFDYVYYEKGYIFLARLFAKIGFSFQMFTVVIYAFECFAVFMLIRKYSQDAMLSMLFFICYQFMTFSMSGLRQVISMSICIFVYFLFDKWKPVPVIIGIALLALSTTIHSSAAFFAVVPLIMLLSRHFYHVTIVEIVGVLLAVLVLKNSFWQYVDSSIRHVEYAGTNLGGNFIFLVIFMLFSVFTYNNYYGLGFLGRGGRLVAPTETIDPVDTMEVRISVACVATLLLLSGGKMLRAVSYITLLLVTMLPNMIQKYRKEQRLVIKTVLILFLLYLFYTDTLVTNQLQVTHYKFFWQMYS